MGEKKKSWPLFFNVFVRSEKGKQTSFFLGLVCTGIAPSTSALMKSRQRNFMQKMALSS